MNRYKVWVCLEGDYDDIVAPDEESAFIDASDAAMEGGSWQYKVELIEENVDNEEEEEE